MSIRIKRRWVLAISCLIITGCTEKTIIREVPASSEPEAGVPVTGVPDSGSPLSPEIDGGTNMVTGETATDQLEDPLTGGGSNMVPAEPEPDTDTDVDTDTDTDTDVDPDIDTETDSGVDTEETLPDEETTDTPLLQDPTNETVDAEQGAGVDCENTVPCSWISEDSQFSVTVTNADNIGAQGQLQLYYSLETSHDTQISVAGGGEAFDETRREIPPSGQTLGSTLGGNTQSLLAGSTLNGRVVFEQGTKSTSLSEWSVTILDGGVARVPVFSNVPVGTITSAYADCELVLPCVWSTPGGDVTITLTSAGGYTINSRLSITFSVLSETTVDVALEAGAMAISAEGVQFTGRTHTLGKKNGYAKITAEAYAGSGLAGSIEYARNSATPTELNEVSLVLYQNDPIPRWNPKFVNVPVQ